MGFQTFLPVRAIRIGQWAKGMAKSGDGVGLRCVFTGIGDDDALSTWVRLDKVRDVVYISLWSDSTLALGRDGSTHIDQDPAVVPLVMLRDLLEADQFLTARLLRSRQRMYIDAFVIQKDRTRRIRQTLQSARIPAPSQFHLRSRAIARASCLGQAEV